MTEAFPLQWPDHRPRAKRTETSAFNITMGRARDGIMREARLMGGRYIVISTNVELRQDGLPYANLRRIEDCGVAVYFERKGQPICFACDRWNTVTDNMRAIQKTIEALRGIARWGTGDMMEAAFKGFEALPPPNWRGDLGLDVDATLEDAESSYRRRARTAHPDTGGTVEAMSRLNIAIDRAREELQ